MTPPCFLIQYSKVPLFPGSMERPESGDKMFMGKHLQGFTSKLPKKNSRFVAPSQQNFVQERLSNHFHATLDDSLYYSRPQGAEPLHGDALSRNGVEGAGFLSVENRVSINLELKSKKELSDLKDKLQNELILVRNFMKSIEGYGGTKLPVDSGVPVRKLKRVHSEVGSLDGPESKPFESDGVPEQKNRGVAAGKVGKGVSQKSSAIIRSEGKIPLSVQKKKSKPNGKNLGEEFVSMFGMGNSSNKVFKSCSLLLNKLMKSKGGWVFNKPVDVKTLGLHDYFTIIKHPMDLGTIKSRLAVKWYRTPEEFAEDVRLTFHNAMIYNMEGHDVNTFAKQLLKIFEDSWVNIEADYLRQSSAAADSEVGHWAPVPTSASVRSPVTAVPLPPPLITMSLPPPVTTGSWLPPVTTASLPPLTDMAMNVDRSEAVTNVDDPLAKSQSVIAAGKTRLPKPKARDLHKREMRLEEKQKLSAELQILPPEKLEGVLRIIKKRNLSLYQNNDEIEVDIDTVDTETLWELDRFVIYYKKSLSKMRRKSAEMAQSGVVTEPNLNEMNQGDSGTEEANDNESGEKDSLSSSSNEGEKGGGNTSASNGSSSSSSDSGSSSDSDTNSSSS